jgi:pyruvate/2-oxoglutarate dehydrogenase complex dihydrolipoamide dehydrogenase (E3) component
MRSFDVVVVGGGPAGEEAAGRLADRGLDVAIVEDRLIGGECAYWACMPSKALRPYRALAEARRVPGAAEAAEDTVNAAAVLRGRDEITNRFDDSPSLRPLEQSGVEPVGGLASSATASRSGAGRRRPRGRLGVRAFAGGSHAGGGTRTPDTRIMIPLL